MTTEELRIDYLRSLYEKETGCKWDDSAGIYTHSYVSWVEKKLSEWMAISLIKEELSKAIEGK